MAYRNAASVLPEPVGAEMRTWSPEAIAGHACSWAAVGPAKAPSNHARVAGLKTSSDMGLRRLLRVHEGDPRRQPGRLAQRHDAPPRLHRVPDLGDVRRQPRGRRVEVPHDDDEAPEPR